MLQGAVFVGMHQDKKLLSHIPQPSVLQVLMKQYVDKNWWIWKEWETEKETAVLSYLTDLWLPLSLQESAGKVIGAPFLQSQRTAFKNFRNGPHCCHVLNVQAVQAAFVVGCCMGLELCLGGSFPALLAALRLKCFFSEVEVFSPFQILQRE